MLNRIKYYCFMFSVVFCLFHSGLSISGENPAVATEENFDIKEEQHNQLVNAMHEDPRGAKLEELLSTGKLAVNARDKSGRTPLMVAESFKHTECIEILKKYHADENARDLDGNSMEHYRQLNKAELQVMFPSSGCTSLRQRCASEPSRIHTYDDSGWNCLCCSDSLGCIDCGACSECLGNCGECMTGCGENLARGAGHFFEALAHIGRGLVSGVGNVMEVIGDFVGDLGDFVGDLGDFVDDFD